MGVRLRRDHAQNQTEANRQACQMKVNHPPNLRDMYTYLSFLISHMHTLMTLLILIKMEIVDFVLYLYGEKSHRFWFNTMRY